MKKKYFNPKLDMCKYEIFDVLSSSNEVDFGYLENWINTELFN